MLSEYEKLTNLYQFKYAAELRDFILAAQERLYRGKGSELRVLA